MDNIYDFFAKPKDPKVYEGVQISLASSDQIREWSHGEIKKPETITTGHSNLKETDFSVQKFSVLLRIMSAIAVNTNA